VGISGSAKIGKDCMIGGGAGIVGHLEITDQRYHYRYDDGEQINYQTGGVFIRCASAGK